MPFLRLGLALKKEDAGCRPNAERILRDLQGDREEGSKELLLRFSRLPRARRNAICAIYAFMRKADDLADDESLPHQERRRQLDAWLAAWHAASASGETFDPVLLAVRDATRRFNIPLSLLDDLVAGTTMDLDIAPGGAPDTYATFDDLYRYCYLVASVVGLVCIRIFGYSDPRAEKFAEETGIAFQLTNILRDVQEDAARNRAYIPIEDLVAHGITLDAFLHRRPGTPPTPNERALLAAMAQRGETYYKSAQELLPLIDPESRPALRVLVSIYQALLKRIERADYDVFSQRASVPLVQKLAILSWGMARVVAARVIG